MSFGAPQWFWALAVLPLLIGLYIRGERRSAWQLREFVSPRLLPQLAGNVDRVRRAIRFGFVLLSLTLAITALAKPRWGYIYEDVKRRGLDLLFAIDTSRSMLSNDVAPNRLERVKLAAQDLITELQGDRAGLIAFAGRAFLQAPLTIDYDAAVESINDLDTKTIPEGGTNISEAIALAVQTFGKSAMGNRALIIFTDGEELSGDAVKEAKKAEEAGVKIFTIGVGTIQGSLIPLEQEGGFVKDAKGEVHKSKLDENRLREIAQATGGMYLHLESGPQTMRQLYEEGLSKLKAAEIDARLSSRPIERYEWPLGGAIAVLIASLFLNDRKKARPQAIRRAPVKREALVTVAILLVAVAQAYAVSGIDLYNKGKYEEALAQFQKDLEHNINPADNPKMHFDAGVAAYKLREYDKALEAFSQSLVDRSPALQEKSRYNLGRTLEEWADMRKTNEEALKDLENAAQHYEEALKLDPNDKAAAERLEIVRKKIEQLKKHPKQPPPQQQKNQQNKKDQKKDQDQQEKDQQQKKDQQQQQQQQQQQKQQQQQQSQNDQQQQQNQQSQNNQQQNRDQQQAKNNQEQRNQQNQQEEQQKDQQQQSSDKRDKDKQQQAKPSPSPGKQSEKKDQHGAGESPTPTPSEGSNASPSPGEGEESPSPSPGENSGAGESPSPTPSSSPNKPRPGEIKSAGEPNKEQQEEQAAEAEAMQRGEMSPQQAARLFQAMKDEEARVQLDERRPVHPVYNDW
jgi:Ca-activated chloride channel family protein